MTVVLYESDLPKAKKIMEQYNSKLIYSKFYDNGVPLYAIEEGPLGALLLIRSKISDPALQKRFGL